MMQSINHVKNKILTPIHLTKNQQLQIDRFIHEINLRDDISFEKLFIESEIKDTLENPRLNKIQKGKRILKFVFEKRYPELTKFSLRFNNLKCKIKPNQYFEDKRISIDFKCNGDYEIRINIQEE